MGQGRRAGSARLGRRRAEAQETEIGVARLCGQSPEAVPREQRGRILRQVAGKRSDLRDAVESLASDRLAFERRSMMAERDRGRASQSPRVSRALRRRDHVDRGAGKLRLDRAPGHACEEAFEPVMIGAMQVIRLGGDGID